MCSDTEAWTLLLPVRLTTWVFCTLSNKPVSRYIRQWRVNEMWKHWIRLAVRKIKSGGAKSVVCSIWCVHEEAVLIHRRFISHCGLFILFMFMLGSLKCISLFSFCNSHLNVFVLRKVNVSPLCHPFFKMEFIQQSMYSCKCVSSTQFYLMYWGSSIQLLLVLIFYVFVSNNYVLRWKFKSEEICLQAYLTSQSSSKQSNVCMFFKRTKQVQ